MNNTVDKSIMPDLVDPNHSYVFKTGEYGIYDYWYVDPRGNYWKYTNAPEDSPDFDKSAGVPLIVKEQPMPATSPSFFTVEGFKRHVAVPNGVDVVRNDAYDPLDVHNIWFEVYEKDSQRRYVYKDSDVRENIDLWVQYQLRVTDAGIPRLRSFAVSSFGKHHPKDRIVGALIMLVDQGLYTIDELTECTVGDLSVVDTTVKLLGRKFLCDHNLLDFLTSLVGSREKSAPLFVLDTVHGQQAVSRRHLYSIFYHHRVSPAYLRAWQANNSFSRIVNRLAVEQVPVAEIESRAFSELKRVFVSDDRIQYLVDYKVKSTLLTNYASSMSKSVGTTGTVDDYATLLLFSDLVGRTSGESEFSEWLHSCPMHDVRPEDMDGGEDDDTPKEDPDAPAVDANGAEVGDVDGVKV